MLSMDPGHEGATRSLILDSLGLRDSDHAVDLIEASIRKGEDLDRLLSALSPRFAEGIREDLFYRPIARLFLERKLWDGALTLLDLWETDLPDSAPEAMARRGWVYLQTDQFQQARETFEKLSPQHQAAKRSLDLLSNLDLVAYGEIFNSVINREHDHAVDLIEASIQRGEDPDRILRALVASSFPIPGFYFFGPVTDRLIERKSWDLALARIMQKI